jgi:hypothetical protein
MLKPIAIVSGLGLGAAAVPGTAEAHCGHNMHGYAEWDYFQGVVYDSGCVGKGWPEYPPYDGCFTELYGTCVQGWYYYDCTC